MKAKIIILILVIALSVSLYINFKSKRLFLDSVFTSVPEVVVEDNYVKVEGSWVDVDRENGFFGKDEVNSIVIDCNKLTSICQESQSILDASDTVLLYGVSKNYEIKEWTDSYIKAEYVGLGMIFEIIINTQNKTASFTARDNPNNPTAGNKVFTAQLKGGLDSN